MLYCMMVAVVCSLFPPLLTAVAMMDMWLTFDVPFLSEQFEVIRIYVLSPFLYGRAHQSDRWLKWCHEVGLLRSDV